MDGLCYIFSQITNLFSQPSPSILEGLIIGLLGILIISFIESKVRVNKGVEQFKVSPEYITLLAKKDENVSINVRDSKIEIFKDSNYCCLYPNWSNEVHCTNQFVCAWIEKNIEFL